MVWNKLYKWNKASFVFLDCCEPSFVLGRAGGEGREAYLVWVPAVCPRTGICAWQPHRWSWRGPGTPTAAPLLSGCPATSALGWRDSATAKTQTDCEEAAAAPNLGRDTCVCLGGYNTENERSSSKAGQGPGLRYANTLRCKQYYVKDNHAL